VVDKPRRQKFRARDATIRNSGKRRTETISIT